METLEQKVNLSRVCRRGTKSSAIVVQSKDDLNNIIQNEIKPLSKGINVLSVLNHKAYNNNNKNNNITNNFPKKNNELITTVLSAKDNRSKRLPFIRKLRNACLSFNNGHAVLVILIVLLLNGGYATARPNLNSNLLDNIDKVVRSGYLNARFKKILNKNYYLFRINQYHNHWYLQQHLYHQVIHHLRQHNMVVMQKNL